MAGRTPLLGRAVALLGLAEAALLGRAVALLRLAVTLLLRVSVTTRLWLAVPAGWGGGYSVGRPGSGCFWKAPDCPYPPPCCCGAGGGKPGLAGPGP